MKDGLLCTRPCNCPWMVPADLGEDMLPPGDSAHRDGPPRTFASNLYNLGSNLSHTYVLDQAFSVPLPSPALVQDPHCPPIKLRPLHDSIPSYIQLWPLQSSVPTSGQTRAFLSFQLYLRPRKPYGWQKADCRRRSLFASFEMPDSLNPGCCTSSESARRSGLPCSPPRSPSWMLTR